MLQKVELYHASPLKNLSSILVHGLLTEKQASNYQRGFLRTIYPGVYVGDDKTYPMDAIYDKLKVTDLVLAHLTVHTDSLLMDEDQIVLFFGFWVMAHEGIPDSKAIQEEEATEEEQFYKMLAVARMETVQQIHKDFAEEFGFNEEQSLRIIQQMIWSGLYLFHKEKVDRSDHVDWPGNFLERHRKMCIFLIENTKFILEDYFNKVDKPGEIAEMTSMEMQVFISSYIIPHDVQYQHETSRETYIHKLEKVDYNPKSDDRINEIQVLYEDGSFAEPAHDIMSTAEAHDNLKSFVEALDECWSKSEILSLARSDPYVHWFLSGYDDDTAHKKLKDSLYHLEKKMEMEL